MGCSRQEYWSGLPCPPSGDLPNPGIQPSSLLSPILTGGFFTTHATWEAPHSCIYIPQIKIGILTRPHTRKMLLLWYPFLRLIVVLSISCLQYFINENMKQFFNGLHEFCILCQGTLFICSQFWVKGQQQFWEQKSKINMFNILLFFILCYKSQPELSLAII